MKTIFFGTLLCSACAFGNPIQPLVVSGKAAIQQKGSLLEIIASDQAVIQWHEFSIGPSEITQFCQPNETSFVLNRVMGTAESLIQGSLKANGQVFLINHNGILVGKNACIDTGSFLASSLDLIDSDDWRFKGDSHTAVVNEGTIIARNGDAVLIGYRVENKGQIDAPMGSALLGAGEDLWIQPQGEEKLFIRLASGQKEGIGIDHSGRIEALRTELKADGNLYSLAVRYSGEIDALGVLKSDGQVFLVAEEGICHVSGSIDAQGGEVRILGKQVALLDGSRIDVSGENGGGAILIGGDYQGKNPDIANAECTFVAKDTMLKADALTNGDGGKVIVWSDESTRHYGQISACGGVEGGDGGLVEVSGKYLDFQGFADRRAPLGTPGLLLLDPLDLVVDSVGMDSVNIVYMAPNYTITGCGISPAHISVMGLGMNLVGGPVTINTSAAPSGGGCSDTGTILWSPANDLFWASGNKLTLIADSSITILSSLFSTSMALASTDVVLDLQAPVIALGDSAHMSVSVPQSIIVSSGAISMTGATSVSLYGGDLGTSCALQAPNYDVTGGAFTLEGGPTDGSGAIIFAFERFHGEFTGDITMDGQGGGAGINSTPSVMPTPPTSVFLKTTNGGNFSMVGGNGSGINVHAGALLNLSGGGDVTLEIDGNFSIQAGGSTSDGNSGIFLADTGTVDVTAADITIISGSNSMASNFVLLANLAGYVNVTSTGSNGILSQGGTADGCNVLCVASGPLHITAPTMEIKGGTASNTESIVASVTSITMDIAGDLNLTTQPFAGAGFAGIANFGPPILTDLNIGGDLNMNAFGGDCFIAGNGPGPHLMTVDAANLNFNSFNDASAFIRMDDGTLTCNVLGTCTFNGAAMTPGMGNSFVGINGASTAGLVANLNVSAGNFVINGGVANSCFAGILLGDPATGVGGGGGEIHVSATSGITLNGGTANDTPAVIEIIGAAATNAITFDSTSGNVVLNGSSVGALTNAGARIATSSGSIIDPVGGSIILNGTMSGPAVISVGAGPASLLLLQAGVNIELQSAFSSIENLSAGDLILVVDNNFSQSPSVGPGAFITAPGSTVLTTGGALRIFSSQQSLNQIQGTLNGLSFTAGPIFVDTALEIWGIYYPSLLGGFPYTIFYKNLNQILTQQANLIVSQLGTSLHPYNEFPGWVERFTVATKGLDPEPYFIRRRQLHLFDHPKTWTWLLPE